MMTFEEYLNLWKTKTLPNKNWKMAGDMPGRINWVIENFSGLESITEMGTYEGCSTVAWLACKPKKLVAIDILPKLDKTTYETYAAQLGIDFEYIIEDDLKITIAETDLLFIDTMHTENHTYKELKAHSNKVKKYLVFHDVNPARFSTHLGIDRWLDEGEKDNWNIFYKDELDCGFLVLARNI